MSKKIPNIKTLQKMASEKNLDCYILLNGGLKSSKTIVYDIRKCKFLVHNWIDDTYDEMTQLELMNSNIGEAIRKGLFIAE